MYFDDIQLGTRIETPEVEITLEELLAFSERYDPVPIHTDAKFAETTRFGRLLAPGMLTYLKVWSLYLPNSLAGEQLVAGTDFSCRWLRPVFAGDVLHGVVTATGKTPRTARDGILEQTLEIYNQSGVMTARCVNTVLVKRAPAAPQ